MDLESLINDKSELTGSVNPPEPIVLSTRIRLARNFTGYAFPGWAKDTVRDEILDMSFKAIESLEPLKEGIELKSEDLDELEKQVLVERHLVSPEFAEAKKGSGLIFSKDQSYSIMINEEDHLRMQLVRNGYRFKPVWDEINALDSQLEEKLNFAFSSELGYLTACPTNLGTGLRASVMLHLPGLVLAGQMEKVIRACNQLNLAVRGIYGEGSEASGSIFQISNQQTLGESESTIIKRLNGVMDSVIEQEENARKLLLKLEKMKLYDKIGRAFGILRNGYFMNSAESMNLLSLMRLGVDLNILDSKYRRVIDKLFVEIQPGHMQVLLGEETTNNDRDIYRAEMLRNVFREIDGLNFKDVIA